MLFGAGSRNLKEAPNVPLGADEFQAVNWSLPLSQRWAQKCGWYARGATHLEQKWRNAKNAEAAQIWFRLTIRMIQIAIGNLVAGAGQNLITI